MKSSVYVEKVYNAAFQEKILVSKAVPSRFVIVNKKSVGQVAVNSVELTSSSRKVCTFDVASIT